MATCANCGLDVKTPAEVCPRCGAPLAAASAPTPTPSPDPANPWTHRQTLQEPEPTEWIRSRIDTPPEIVTTPTDRKITTRSGAFARPEAYPTYWSWLITAAGRNKLGLLAALIVTWYNLPLAIGMAAGQMIMFGTYGLIGGLVGSFVGLEKVPVVGDVLSDIPLLNELTTAVLTRAGGIVGMFIGLGAGALSGFLTGLIGPVALYAHFRGWPAAVGLLLSQIPIAALFGLLYTTYAIASERIRFKIAGYRRPSRREREFFGPILEECARRLDLPDLPTLLIDDDRAVNMYTGARHMIITRGFMDEFTYDPEPIAGVMCHELAHWRNADQVSSYLIRGVALPIYLVVNFVSWVVNLVRDIRGGVIIILILYALTWPVLVCMRFVIMPLQMLHGRGHEYQSDRAAVAAGYRNGMRRVLARLRASFDGARNGWEQSTLATHPPNELRLERIEEPGVNYPLPDDDAPSVPVPGIVTSSLQRD